MNLTCDVNFAKKKPKHTNDIDSTSPNGNDTNANEVHVTESHTKEIFQIREKESKPIRQEKCFNSEHECY